MYNIVIRKQAKKKLQSLSASVRVRIAEKIVRLGHNPDDPSLDIKKLLSQPYFRLRVGDWRIIFDKQEELKVISIEKIGARGDVYK
ncbi:MAG: type II toxin-antitoxin system RelE/ParE family toxin [Candidatus Berkiella sp.]